jgi:hypothetical protein
MALARDPKQVADFYANGFGSTDDSVTPASCARLAGAGHAVNWLEQPVRPAAGVREPAAGWVTG